MGADDSRFASWGYAGLVATFGLPWALVALICARGTGWAWVLLGVAMAMRYAVALVVGRTVLQDRQVPKWLALVFLRDFAASLVWLIGFWGHTVTWRGGFVYVEGRQTGTNPSAASLRCRRWQQFETAVRIKTIPPSPPDNRISEESGQPEAEGVNVLDRQQQPVDLCVQDPRRNCVSRQQANCERHEHRRPPQRVQGTEQQRQRQRHGEQLSHIA